MRPLETRVLEVIVVPKDKPIFDELATRIRIDDEAAGEFVVVKQDLETNGAGEIRVDPGDWPAIREAIDKMVSECRELK